MARKAKRAAIDRSQAASYLAKAEEFLRSAEWAAAASDHDAAMLNTIHAAISATDAVTVSLAGVRSTDPDHQRAADLLLEVAGVEEGRGSSSSAPPAPVAQERGGVRVPPRPDG